MVYAYSKFDYVATTEQSEKTVESLGLGYNATYLTDVLHKSHNLKLRNYDLKLKTQSKINPIGRNKKKSLRN